MHRYVGGTVSPAFQPRGPFHISSILGTDRIVPEMVSRTRWPAIDELVHHLEAQGLLTAANHDELLGSLRAREEFTSSGIGSGIAIPHAFADDVEQTVAVLGRSRAGIEFDSLDHAPVHLVILFIVPRHHYAAYLSTLSAIARVIQNEALRRELIDAPSACEMLATLRRRSQPALAA